MVLWSSYTKRTLPLHSMELIEQFWTVARSWSISCVRRLFRAGCLVDLEAVSEGRNKADKCDLVVGIVPSMLRMRAIGLLRSLIPEMLLEANRAIEGDQGRNSMRRKMDVTRTKGEKKGRKMDVTMTIVPENTANHSINTLAIINMLILVADLVSKGVIENAERVVVDMENAERVVVDMENAERVVVDMENAERVVVDMENTEGMKDTEGMKNTEMKEDIESTEKATVERGKTTLVMIAITIILIVINNSNNNNNNKNTN